MHSIKALLLTAALAGTSLSQKSDSPACSSAFSVFMGLIPEAPATPTEILSFIAANTQIPSFTIGDAESHQSQLCAVAAALPSSLLPELQTLGSELMDFAHSYTSELVAYITACAPDSLVASSTSYFNHVLTYTGNICTETASPTPGGASNGTYPTPTLTATSNVTSSTIFIPTAAAARPTGALLRAAAAGGVIGAAAML
ncbi:hypothetical protein F5B22DRAFT_612878 [Xylaria bambusicola]|uniref:uncharacterized protein n=1 Tax=Xylaria bambusicola TaxID=326684 RepID=UPI00200780D6|nr:uncharacterized protein F5B22DRAFT_612878 [Xylaria bambusicola]KAI0512978.1 hypothetical protein F5B22DRAFT_612878 [Xylaria bambusicola]